jgi:hypothetical protein
LALLQAAQTRPQAKLAKEPKLPAQALLPASSDLTSCNVLIKELNFMQLKIRRERLKEASCGLFV